MPTDTALRHPPPPPPPLSYAPDYRRKPKLNYNEATFLSVMLSVSYVHRSDLVNDSSSEAHSSMALRIYLFILAIVIASDLNQPYLY